MNNTERPNWLRAKGYLHITAQLDIEKNEKRLLAKILNPDYVKRYPFYPLMHSTIKERRYKRLASDAPKRAHSYKDSDGKHQRNIKERPLHYATHMDALIFGHYAELLQAKYEERVKIHAGLTDCIIAYRKIPSEVENKHKSTIHFAYEFFEEIKRRTNGYGECVVLTFDIKSFFSSLNHEILKNAWADIIGQARLPDDHYNVFKASTLFSYIFLNELRISKRGGFDEKERARIRNKHGINALFDSPKSFREKVKDGSIKLHKYPFRDKTTGIPIGIPQGLPISAVLANLYLLSFDLKILNSVVSSYNAYYRRYSDDIVIVCNTEDADFIEGFITHGIEDSKVEISANKTEKFVFKKLKFGNKDAKITCVKLLNGKEHITPLNYLGFEFNGQKALIKSANIAKFYRRMISSVKSKARRAKKLANQNGTKPVIFRTQLYRLYTTKPLTNKKMRTRWKRLEKNRFGNYTLKTIDKTKLFRSNYLSYIDRASEIMQEPSIKNQIRKHKTIFNQAVHRHLKD